MENYPITVITDNETYYFEVGEYLHHDNESCKYKVFIDGEFVASFEQDDHQFLHICQNPGKIDKELLHQLADQIEMHHPFGIKQGNKS